MAEKTFSGACGVTICSDKFGLPVYQIINGVYCCKGITKCGCITIPYPGDYVVLYDDCCPWTCDPIEPPFIEMSEPCSAAPVDLDPAEPIDTQVSVNKISYCSAETNTTHVQICRHVITLSTGDVQTEILDDIDTGSPCGDGCDPVAPLGLSKEFTPL